MGVCVQRFPTLSRAKTDLEQRFEEMQMVIRTERSRLSDFELEEAEYFRKKKKRERMAMEEDLDESQVCSGVAGLGTRPLQQGSGSETMV